MASLTKVRGAVLNAFKIDTSSEVSITAATTLNSSAFGRMHVINLAVDGTIVLPTVSGNVGKLIGIRISGDCTKLVTLDANGSELIDGAATRVMWAGESAILLCDGVGYTKIAGKFIPMVGKIQASSSQSILTSTWTAISLSTIQVDIGGLCDVASNRILIRRAGYYNVSASLTMSADISFLWTLFGCLSVKSAGLIGTGGASSPASLGLPISPGGTIKMNTYNTSGSTNNTDYTFPAYISVSEVPSW